MNGMRPLGVASDAQRATAAAAVQKQLMARPSTDTTAEIPKDAATWLRALGMEQYAGVFTRSGLETTFAIGLLTSAGELMECGLWRDDAVLLFEHTQGPRTLVQRWSPMISRIPTDTTVARYLQCTPVPLLSLRAEQLAQHGYDCLAALKHFQKEDGVVVHLSLGHSLALHHIALLMNDPGVMPKTIAIPLNLWLANISPPMQHYAELIRLVRPEVGTVESLLSSMRREDVMAMLISIGHRRTLWSHILRARTYWLDPL